MESPAPARKESTQSMDDQKHKSIAQTSAENEATALARAREMRKAAVASPKLLAAEQRRVAENLWGILLEVQRHGVTKAQVLQAAGQGSREDSTKRLPRFALNPDLSPEEKEKRSAHLTKKVVPYLGIAAAAAKLLRRDENAFIPALLAGTRFAALEAAPSDEDEVSVELAEIVRQIAAGLSRKHDLTGLFRLIRSRTLCRYWDGLRQNIDGRWDLWDSFTDGALVLGLQDDSFLWSLPYPHVLLGWTTLAEDIPFRLQRCRPGAGRWPTPADYQDWGEGDEAPQIVKGRLLAEVRLAILPVGAGGAPEAAFLTRIWTQVEPGQWKWEWAGPEPWWEVAPGNLAHPPRTYVSTVPGFGREFGYPFEPCFYEGQDGFALHPDVEPKVWQSALGRIGWAKASLRFHDEFASGALTRIDVVSPASCHRLFSLFSAWSPLTGVNLDNIVADPPQDLSEVEMLTYWRKQEEASDTDLLDEHIRTPAASLAHVLERSIFHTAPERRLDLVLDRVCGALAAEVRGYLRPIDEHRERVKAALRAKWGATASDGKNTPQPAD